MLEISSCRFRTRLSLNISSLRLASAIRRGEGASGGQFSWHVSPVHICFDGGIDSLGHMELVCIAFNGALGHFQRCFEQIFLGQDVIVYSVLRGKLRKKGGHARMEY